MMATGGAICGSFVVLGGLSAMLYRPWRRRVERNRKRNVQQHLQDDKEQGTLPKLQEALPDLEAPRRDEETLTIADERQRIHELSRS